MNLNASMQNLIAPNTRISGGELDALSALGQQLELDPALLEGNPELLKLLGEASEEIDFAQLLKGAEGSETSESNGKLAELMKNLGTTEGEGLENVDTEAILKSIGEGKLDEGKLKKLLADGKIDPKLLASLKKNAGTKETSVQPKLQNLDAFVANQAASKKVAMKNAYKSQAQKSMFSKKIDAQIPKLEGTKANNTSEINADKPMKVTDLMLMTESDNSEATMDFSGQKNNQITKATATTNAGKVFDMNSLVINKSDVIGQIQDYIIQSKVSSEPNVQMSFEHKDLGVIDLQVSKLDNNQLNIMINSRSQEGAKFFTQNQGELLQTLNQAGLQVADLKLDSSSQSNMNNNSNDSSFSGEQEKQNFANNKDQRDSDSKRREELWKLFNENEAA